jgi:hypothetical protein
MKLTKKSFRERVKALFAKAFSFAGIVTNSILKKFFPDFRVTSPESWANLADELIIMDNQIQEKSELELLCEKHSIFPSQREDKERFSIYSKENEFLGELTQNFLGQWFYAFRSSGFSRRARDLEGAIIMLLNNPERSSNFKKKSKEYYDLFST